MRINTESVKTFLFDPLNKNHSTLKKVASVITNIALTILSAGLYLPVFLYKHFTKEQKAPNPDPINDGAKPASSGGPTKIHCPEGQTVFVINKEVYNVTKFLSAHPGGDEILKSFAGQDATRNFNDTGHSDVARNAMKQYKVCSLSEWQAQHVHG